MHVEEDRLRPISILLLSQEDPFPTSIADIEKKRNRQSLSAMYRRQRKVLGGRKGKLLRQ